MTKTIILIICALLFMPTCIAQESTKGKNIKKFSKEELCDSINKLQTLNDSLLILTQQLYDSLEVTVRQTATNNQDELHLLYQQNDSLKSFIESLYYDQDRLVFNFLARSLKIYLTNKAIEFTKQYNLHTHNNDTVQTYKRYYTVLLHYSETYDTIRAWAEDMSNTQSLIGIRNVVKIVKGRSGLNNLYYVSEYSNKNLKHYSTYLEEMLSSFKEILTLCDKAQNVSEEESCRRELATFLKKYPKRN